MVLSSKLGIRTPADSFLDEHGSQTMKSLCGYSQIDGSRVKTFVGTLKTAVRYPRVAAARPLTS